MELRLPDDFLHDAPRGYSYSVSKFKINTMAIWLNDHKEYVYTKDPVKTIWGFVRFTKQGYKYYSPITSKSIGKEVDIGKTRPYTAMQPNFNPLEHALYS
tara:strand:- start:176 stop:475 length:300 start_codon:yes stop_codon:yes gene_type:complete